MSLRRQLEERERQHTIPFEQGFIKGTQLRDQTTHDHYWHSSTILEEHKTSPFQKPTIQKPQKKLTQRETRYLILAGRRDS